MFTAATPIPDSMLSLLRALVAVDTTSHRSNRPAADLLADWLTQRGCTVARFDSGDDKVNLLARKGPDQPGGLLVSGHLDVVPALETSWTSDPFTLTEAGDRFIARGACDMKGFVSIAAQLLADVAADRMQVPLVGLFTHDEEIGTVGAQRFVEQWDGRWALPRSAIIGEPTELRVVRMHKGHLKLRVTVHGRSAHSGYPHLGINAIEKMGDVLQRLTNLRAALSTERESAATHFADVPFVVMNLAQVTGGRAVNIIPDGCTLDVGVRLLPGMRTADFCTRFKAALGDGVADGSVGVEIIGDSPPLNTPADAAINQRLGAWMGQTDTGAVHYASDAGPLAQLDIASVLYGPGSIEVAHQPNEYLPMAQYSTAYTQLSGFVAEWCNEKEVEHGTTRDY